MPKVTPTTTTKAPPAEISLVPEFLEVLLNDLDDEKIELTCNDRPEDNKLRNRLIDSLKKGFYQQGTIFSIKDADLDEWKVKMLYCRESPEAGEGEDGTENAPQVYFFTEDPKFVPCFDETKKAWVDRHLITNCPHVLYKNYLQQRKTPFSKALLASADLSNIVPIKGSIKIGYPPLGRIVYGAKSKDKGSSSTQSDGNTNAGAPSIQAKEETATKASAEQAEKLVQEEPTKKEGLQKESKQPLPEEPKATVLPKKASEPVQQAEKPAPVQPPTRPSVPVFDISNISDEEKEKREKKQRKQKKEKKTKASRKETEDKDKKKAKDKKKKKTANKESEEEEEEPKSKDKAVKSKKGKKTPAKKADSEEEEEPKKPSSNKRKAASDSGTTTTAKSEKSSKKPKVAEEDEAEVPITQEKKRVRESEEEESSSDAKGI